MWVALAIFAAAAAYVLRTILSFRYEPRELYYSMDPSTAIAINLIDTMAMEVTPTALIIVASVKAMRLSGLLPGREKIAWAVEQEEQAIKTRVEAFWNSEEFLTCLKTALPKGKDDAKHGLDYVPYMLQNVEARRARYSRSAAAFLSLTVGASIIFSLIVVFFGYNIINESAAALPRSVLQLTDVLKRATDVSRTLAAEFQGTNEFRQQIGTHISRLEKFESDDALRALHLGIVSRTSATRLSGDFGPLAEELKAALESETMKSAGAGSKATELKAILTALKDGVQDLVARRNALPIVFASVVERTKETAEAVKRATESPEARTVELWKRIALGIVVCTFFFAILRYFARIYREHHSQEQIAERDDFDLRQFVVAFKGSEADAEARRSILTNFAGTRSGKATGVAGDQLSSEEANVLKELIAAVVKKMQ